MLLWQRPKKIGTDHWSHVPHTLGVVSGLGHPGLGVVRNNYFGAIVLGVYGLFWVADGMLWAISLGWFGTVGDKADPRQLAFACFGYTTFSLFIMIAAFEANKVFAVILVLINILFPMGLSILGIHRELFSVLAAYSEPAISLLGLYCAGAVFLNTYVGRALMPLGKLLDFIEKGADGQRKGALQAADVLDLKKIA